MILKDIKITTEKEYLQILENIIAKTPGHIWWKDKNLKFLGCNDQQAKTVGLKSRHEIIGKKSIDITSRNQLPIEWKKQALAIDRRDKEIISTGIGLVVEEPLVLLDGTEAIYLSKKEPMKDESGNIIGLIGMSFDITAQKIAKSLEIENIRLEAENKLNKVILEKAAIEAEAERFRLENEVHRLQNEAYLAEKKLQERITKFSNKILHEIQSFRIEELHENAGYKLEISDADRQIKLTRREQQILYFLSLNKSPKNIAQIITAIENKLVSDSTINALVNKKLYPKFNVFNVGQLVEKAMILNLIPLLLDKHGY